MLIGSTVAESVGWKRGWNAANFAQSGERMAVGMAAPSALLSSEAHLCFDLSLICDFNKPPVRLRPALPEDRVLMTRAERGRCEPAAPAHRQSRSGILMLRAIWEQDNVIDYQLLEIPLTLLRKMHGCQALPVGRRQGRKSLGFDVVENDQILFHIHFDGADGKCQLRGLRVDRCNMLAEWQQATADE
jgi:hypothetical protein